MNKLLAGLMIGLLWAGSLWAADPAAEEAATLRQAQQTVCARDRRIVERMAMGRDAGLSEDQSWQRWREIGATAPPVLQAMWQTNLSLVYARYGKTPTEVGAELEAHCLSIAKP